MRQAERKLSQFIKCTIAIVKKTLPAAAADATVHSFLVQQMIFPAAAGASACPSPRSYQAPRVGISPNKVALHVGIHFYVDKELMVSGKKQIKSNRWRRR